MSAQSFRLLNPSGWASRAPYRKTQGPACISRPGAPAPTEHTLRPCTAHAPHVWARSLKPNGSVRLGRPADEVSARGRPGGCVCVARAARDLDVIGRDARARSELAGKPGHLQGTKNPRQRGAARAFLRGMPWRAGVHAGR